MRVTTLALQHLYTQVGRTNDGKFLLSPIYTDVQTPQQLPAQQKPASEEVPSPVAFPGCESSVPANNSGPKIIGNRFLMIGPTEGSTLFKCVDVVTGQKLIAKEFTMADKSDEALMLAHVKMQEANVASPLAGVADVPGGKKYLLFKGHHGDMHTYIRSRKRRLSEAEGKRLFRQIVRIVTKCHENGVVLRDLKLRKFVFTDEERTQLHLETLEDAIVLETNNDHLTERRGCPAYVAPEVLRFERAYAGKAADIWSLGILLYTMLVSRYPFHGAAHSSLFAKISRGQYVIPDNMSPRARCLIKALLRRDPSERPLASDILRHPWLTRTSKKPISVSDRLVPELNLTQD